MPKSSSAIDSGPAPAVPCSRRRNSGAKSFRVQPGSCLVGSVAAAGHKTCLDRRSEIAKIPPPFSSFEQVGPADRIWPAKSHLFGARLARRPRADVAIVFARRAAQPARVARRSRVSSAPPIFACGRARAIRAPAARATCSWRSPARAATDTTLRHEAIARGAAAVVAERLLPIGVPTVRGARLARSLWPDLPGAGRAAQPVAAGHRRHRHQRQNDHHAPDRQHSARPPATAPARWARWAIATRSRSAPADLTTPAAPVLARWLGRMVDARLLARRDGSFEPRPGPAARSRARVRPGLR